MTEMISLLLASLLAASLADAESALAAGDPDAALPVLAALEERGGLAHADHLRLLVLRGTAQAFVDDKDAAIATFVTLLTLAPTQTLPYDASPKVTFAFEAARERASRRRALDIALVVPAVARLDEPIAVTVVRHADIDAHVRSVSVWHRDKGQTEWQRIDAALSADQVTLQVPARRSQGAAVDDSGRPGVLVEVALVGVDVRGSQVLLAPGPGDPLEVPVGYDAPPPWYMNPWMWTGAVVTGVVLAGAATAALVVANVPPDTIRVTSQAAP
jgi:hypothetical protein